MDARLDEPPTTATALRFLVTPAVFAAGPLRTTHCARCLSSDGPLDDHVMIARENSRELVDSRFQQRSLTLEVMLHPQSDLAVAPASDICRGYQDAPDRNRKQSASSTTTVACSSDPAPSAQDT